MGLGQQPGGRDLVPDFRGCFRLVPIVCEGDADLVEDRSLQPGESLRSTETWSVSSLFCSCPDSGAAKAKLRRTFVPRSRGQLVCPAQAGALLKVTGTRAEAT